MAAFIDPIEVFNDPRVKAYFLGILDSNQYSSEEKYYKFLSFFEEEARIKSFILLSDANNKLMRNDENQVLSQISQELGFWKPQEILLQLRECINRAIRRLRDSQHNDGGWGRDFRISNCWGTTHAILCLNSVMKHSSEYELPSDINKMLERGIQWLDKNRWSWAVEDIPRDQKIFVYEISMVVSCFYQLGKNYFGEEFSSAISECLERLVHCQNGDGGWEARNENIYEQQLCSQQHSEIGATSFALRALALATKMEAKPYGDVIEKAMKWLIDAQNMDGSWNYENFSDTDSKPIKSVSKTCDALQSFIAAEDFGVVQSQPEKIDRVVRKAITWLESQEKPILDRGRIEGWGWEKESFQSFNLENTCTTLEVLVRMPQPSLPLLASTGNWLMKQQYKEGEERVKDNKDVGKWEGELTARVAYSLIEYSDKLKEFLKAQESRQAQS